MRYIDQSLKDKLLSAQQTLFNKADPRMSVIVSRPVNPITNKNYWQEDAVATNVTATHTSIAVRKQGMKTPVVYIAYVDDGTLIVKAATLRHSAKQMSWTIVETIPNCLYGALDFDGQFIHDEENNVEWQTNDLPMLAYVSNHGQLLWGELGSEYTNVVSGAVTYVDMIHGFESEDKTDSQGIITFYVSSGKLYSKQYIDGAWETASQVTMAGMPTNIIRVHAERLFDYRIVLQVLDDEDKLYEVFSKMEAHGWHANENIKASITAHVELPQVLYSSYQRQSENIAGAIENNRTETGSIFSPFMYEVRNINNGLGDYGKQIEIEWSENIYAHNSLPNSFRITDGDGVVQYAQSIVSTDGWRKLIIEFINFNNFVGDLLLEYAPGLVAGCATPVSIQSFIFTPTNLVPYYLPGPVALTVENIQDWSEA